MVRGEIRTNESIRYYFVHSQKASQTLIGIYILLGEDENGAAQAYIGETTNGVQRINNHKSHKLFWNKCLMFVAKDNM